MYRNPCTREIKKVTVHYFRRDLTDFFFFDATRYLPQISRTVSSDLGSPTACGARPEGFVMAAYEKTKIQGKGWKSLVKPKIFGHSLFFTRKNMRIAQQQFLGGDSSNFTKSSE